MPTGNRKPTNPELIPMKPPAFLIAVMTLLASIIFTLLFTGCSATDRAALKQDASRFGTDAAISAASVTLTVAEMKLGEARRDLLEEQMRPNADPLEVAGKILAVTLAEDLVLRLQERITRLEDRIDRERYAADSGKAPLLDLLPTL